MIEQLPTGRSLPELAGRTGYTVTVRGLVLMCSIGIRRREREHAQRVRVSVDLVAGDAFPGEDRRRIINYEKVVAAIREIARSGHIDLCEGFAERVCAACFIDPRVERVRVWVEKLDVFPDTEGVGAILERTRPARA
jgi:dihydroneopterin aldolase